MTDRLYNSDVKIEYMETQISSKNTRTTTLHEFLKIAETEKELDKDVYAFNDIEISNLLRAMRRSNVMSIRKTLSILNDYVRWCIVSGKRGKYEKNLNYVDLFIKTEKDLMKYVSNRQLYNKILNKEEFEELLRTPKNPSDQAILLCLYEFIGGEELCELRNIQISDIDKKTNTIILKNIDGTERTSKISDRLIRILKEANDEMMYLSNNGEPSKRGIIMERPLAESKYVFRSLKKSANDFQIIQYQTILNRIKMIRKFTDYKHITSNSLRETRIIHEILDMTSEKGLYEPTDDIYEEVADEIKQDFNIELSHIQKYSLKQKVKQILNIKEF